jgi:hypothetical protein
LATDLPPSSFIAAVARDVHRHYAEQGHEPRHHVRGRLAQFWWGNTSAFHYELWIHERTLQLELGLHFEGPSHVNEHLLAEFSRHLVEIQQELGDSIWLEPWDKGWARLYETQPLMPLDEGRVFAVTSRLCEIADCLQPILDSLLRAE